MGGTVWTGHRQTQSSWETRVNTGVDGYVVDRTPPSTRHQQHLTFKLQRYHLDGRRVEGVHKDHVGRRPPSRNENLVGRQRPTGVGGPPGMTTVVGVGLSDRPRQSPPRVTKETGSSIVPRHGLGPFQGPRLTSKTVPYPVLGIRVTNPLHEERTVHRDNGNDFGVPRRQLVDTETRDTDRQHTGALSDHILDSTVFHYYRKQRHRKISNRTQNFQNSVSDPSEGRNWWLLMTLAEL